MSAATTQPQPAPVDAPAPVPVPRGVFVTGTDTGVGKTRVSTALAWLLASRGIDVRVRKPVESGCPEGPDGALLPQDASALRQAAGSRESLDSICANRLRAPLSPERAARLEGVALAVDALAAACLRGVPADGMLLVEGAGGFLSPVAEQALNADLATRLGLPVVLVAADRLGTINHTLLTVEAVRARGLTVAAVVLSQPDPCDEDGMDNTADLSRWLDMPVHRLPHGSATGERAWPLDARFLGALADALGDAARANAP
jgi:dethiobiotin synthetase